LISAEITYYSPANVDEALALLDEHGADITVLSGGMSLLPMMNLGLATPDRILSLNHLDGLAGVTETDTEVIIGARTNHVDVQTNEIVRRGCPAVSSAAAKIGDVQVRNRGTIGGSISHADPSADYLPALCASGASIELRSRAKGTRIVESGNFFLDLMYTDKGYDELITAIHVPKVGPGYGCAYIRFARVEGSFAIVNAAAVLAPDNSVARLALGGIAPRPVTLDIRSHGAQGWTAAAIDAVGEEAYASSEDASGDVTSDADYKRAMARVHAVRVMRAATEQMAGSAG
jgi:carbon-monoxide dehydrogenase medium subunit